MTPICPKIAPNVHLNMDLGVIYMQLSFASIRFLIPSFMDDIPLEQRRILHSYIN
jgi:hypothetical protein